ncbi:hypothetical protein S40285_02917 [Stachybotrys chlorohalonatus IBT 40285]|uniref:HOOK N-terminal domain-containing protein n=1 Tax=Stachybotrys chlorohalonatus (strain IBT 40285) TaxID=1283841 RepID=A0A084QK70_STAC4|nr:hypothetical protein S40285_02917 [Stachybotrys chlorohalonata IBT 40285]
MPTYSASAQAALLKAVCIFLPSHADSGHGPLEGANTLTLTPSQVNRVFDLNRTAESLDELANGLVLAQILHELDPEFSPAELDTSSSTSKYLTNKRNIQAVYKGLFRFIRRQLPELGCQAKKFDYHAVAENPDPQGISQLLAVMVSAATMGPDNQRYIPRIQHGLDRETQAEIMQIIRAMQQDIANSKDDDDLDEAIDAVMEARDIDLLVEEQNAALRQQLDKTNKTLSDYITRLEHLQISHEELKYEKEKNDRELEVLRKATQDGANSAEAIKLLEAQVHEQMEIIARSEESIRNHNKIKTQLEGEVQRLSQKSIQADELRDQVAEWKHKAEELEKKANTAERYKQKLESQQHLVKEVQNLQYERAELQEQLRSLVADKDRGDRTRKAEDELTKMITQSEQHLWDERNQKNQLIKDVTVLEEELSRLRNQINHDERFIQDLQEQLQHGGGGSSQPATIGAVSGLLNLEEELSGTPEDDGQPNFALEISRLKSENNLLRGTMGPTGDAASSRLAYEEIKRQLDRVQRERNDFFEKHAVAQDQLEAIIANATAEELVKMIDAATNEGPLNILTSQYYRTKVFIDLKAQLASSLSELDRTKQDYKTLERQVTDQNRELLEARSKLSAMSKQELDAVEELRGADKLIADSLKSEVERLRLELGDVTHERDAQKTQLIEALLAKDKLRKEAEGHRDGQDSLDGLGDTDVAAKKSADKIEKLRTRLKERTQQFEKSEQDKIDLQRKLKLAQGGEASAALRAETEQTIKNLQRENSLMATAWYDLTTRLQSNHVGLQRRPEPFRGFVNKQRQMVNGQLRRRDSLYLY